MSILRQYIPYWSLYLHVTHSSDAPSTLKNGIILLNHQLINCLELLLSHVYSCSSGQSPMIPSNGSIIMQTVSLLSTGSLSQIFTPLKWGFCLIISSLIELMVPTENFIYFCFVKSSQTAFKLFLNFSSHVAASTDGLYMEIIGGILCANFKQCFSAVFYLAPW